MSLSVGTKLTFNFKNNKPQFFFHIQLLFQQNIVSMINKNNLACLSIGKLIRQQYKYRAGKHDKN